MSDEYIHNTRVIARRILEDPQFLKEGELMSDDRGAWIDGRMARYLAQTLLEDHDGEHTEPEALESEIAVELQKLIDEREKLLARVKELEAELEDAKLEAKEEAERR